MALYSIRGQVTGSLVARETGKVVAKANREYIVIRGSDERGGGVGGSDVIVVPDRMVRGWGGMLAVASRERCQTVVKSNEQSWNGDASRSLVLSCAGSIDVRGGRVTCGFSMVCQSRRGGFRLRQGLSKSRHRNRNPSGWLGGWPTQQLAWWWCRLLRTAGTLSPGAWASLFLSFVVGRGMAEPCAVLESVRAGWFLFAGPSRWTGSRVGECVGRYGNARGLSCFLSAEGQGR